jgi:hypothetical protein
VFDLRLLNAGAAYGRIGVTVTLGADFTLGARNWAAARRRSKWSPK